MKSLYEEIIKKLMDYNRKYSDRPSKFALKASSYCALLALKNIFQGKNTPAKNNKSENIKIAFVLSNMVGDVLVNLHYIEQFHTKIQHKNVQLDIYTNLNNEVISGLLYKKDFFSSINKGTHPDKKSYDLIIELVRYPEILHHSEKLESDNEEFFPTYIHGLLKFKAENPIFYLNGSWGDRVGIEYARLKGKNRRTQSDINDYLQLEKTDYFLDVDPDFESVLNLHGLADRKYITFQRGIAGAGEYTRLWPLENYEKIVQQLHRDYPEYKLVQLGRQDTKKIDGIDVDLRGKTSFEELKNILKKSAVHIDGDCGMVHFRHSLQGGPSIVLFGPTSAEFIGYPENINLRGDGCPNFCEWINNNWQEKCIAGFESLPCMASPDKVYEQLEILIGRYDR